ncbi:MAG: phospholipid carrier-dependent glycosyltransferase [Chloroflexi bacterium]|nr:phospholipid carrier-dependent glycosyltransferase [Chloroflexota bacterium]
MSGPAIGEPDPDRAERSRAGFRDAAGSILVLLALGLAFRLIIAYLLPGSGFKVDLASFQFWANNLADSGLGGFYDRPFFHDYTPGYLYVLWLVGGVANVLGGGVGDLIKIPPILGDLALAYLVWSMTRELGGSVRAARIGALLVIINPVTWFDSVVWGQVDSVGVVVLLLALRELWRDRPERAAILATLAALIKPQLGILIPIVAIVVIRRAFWPRGGFGRDEDPEPRTWTLGLEERIRGPIRVVTTGLAGLLTAIFVSLPFGLSFPGLIAQIFKTAAGYPYLSVNAFNPWALVIQTTAGGREQSLALNRSWVCDSTIAASPAGDFRIGDWPIWSWPASTQTCDPGMLIGAFPAALVGAALFVIAAAVVVWLVARRPDRITTLVGLAILSLAFFVLPTRVHERYLFPLAAVGAILATVSIRWRIAYVLSAAATFANMYVVLTTYYRDNPGISDWLGMGATLASPWGVAIASVTQALILGWAFFQLREEAVEGIADGVATAGHDPHEHSRLAGWLGRRPPDDGPSPDLDPHEPQPASSGSPAPWAGPLSGVRPAAVPAGPGPAAAAVATPVAPPAAAGAVVVPVWDVDRDAGSLGPWGWFRARLRDSPVRADRSRLLEGERGGRLDRLDAWMLAVLAISLLTVRMWRLDEPYQMYFDEVYHPRTATEFLQDWRYGLSHDIYEWTHPHLAKYAMALGLVALGEDRVSARSQLNVAVVDAVVEPRRDDGLDSSRIEGDRLWVATGSEVRAYDLATRELAGRVTVPDAVALAYDTKGHTLYIGTRSGEIRAVDVGALDATRRGPPVDVDSRAFMSVDGPIDRLYATRNGERLAAVLQAGFGTTDSEHSQVVVIDATAALELSRPSLRGVGQISEGVSDDRLAVATADGVSFIELVSGAVTKTLDVGGPVSGIVGIWDIQDDPLYASVSTPTGPKFAVIIAKRDAEPRVDRTYILPGARAGRAYYDLASRMVHIEGSVPVGAGGVDSGGADTVYVIEPHGNAVYADAVLPYVPTVMVMDENQEYPSTDREQLLAFDAGGQVAAVEVGRHAYAWRVPGVIAGVLMALFMYVLARLLFRRRSIAVMVGVIALVDGMLFAQSRIGMNDSYVGLGIVAAYTIFAALWLHPGNSRRHWVAFALGVPLIGFFLGFALASKWVAAYAIGGLGMLSLARSALGRLLLIVGLVVLTTALGYVAISVPAGQSGGNYVFLVIMFALVIAAVLANTLHPVAWTVEELRFAVGAPIAAGVLAMLYGLSRGDATLPVSIGPITATPIQLAMFAFLGAAVVYVGFYVLGRIGFGPLALPPEPDDPAAILEPPREAPQGWLRLGAGFGLPAIWLAVGLLVIPIGLYVVSYIPWAMVEGHQLWAGAVPGTGWPPGNTGQTLLDLTSTMYAYHNNLSSAHPASSPWWAWPLDLKPVWFYEEGFAGGTSASIYDAGNLVAWWLAIPALAFVAWQAFKRRSAALALIGIGFAVQWISWARIDRAAFEYHYYTSLPFVFLALAYFLAELWHGTSRRIWLLARLSAAAAILGPFGLWVMHRPLCAIARVTDMVPNSQACPTLIPDVTISPRAIAIAVVIGVGVLLLLRELLALSEEDDPDRLAVEQAAGGWRAAMGRLGLGSRWATAAVIATLTSIAFVVVSTAIPDSDGLKIANIPVEPIALFVTLALSPVAAYVATARDARRFVLGALGAMVFWFILWYPNISGLPLPAAIHNAYQGFLPTYLYPFQFWVLQGDRAAAPSLFAPVPAVMLLAIAFTSIVVAYSAWSWRIVLAERRRDRLAPPEDPGPGEG